MLHENVMHDAAKPHNHFARTSTQAPTRHEKKTEINRRTHLDDAIAMQIRKLSHLLRKVHLNPPSNEFHAKLAFLLRLLRFALL